MNDQLSMGMIDQNADLNESAEQINASNIVDESSINIKEALAL